MHNVVDLIMIIIERSNGSIRSLKDLALFLKNNLNISDYEVKVEEPGLVPLFPKKRKFIVHNAARYGGAVKLLMRAFDLRRSEAEELLDLLEDAGWIRIERMMPDWSMGMRDSSLVVFKI